MGDSMNKAIFNNDKNNAFNELLGVIDKGVTLLGKGNIDQGLFDAWNKYVVSTVRLIDVAYGTNYNLHFSDSYNNNDWFNLRRMGVPVWENDFVSPVNSIPNVWDFSHHNRFANTALGIHDDSEYKHKLISTLHRLINIAQSLPKE